MNFKIAALAILTMSACVPFEPDEPPPVAPQPGDLVEQPTQGVLIEREPDLCQAADYQIHVGQPATVVETLAITRPYRVIEHGGIFSQEYNAGRLNFWLSRTGTIIKVDCG